jgi:hypothetical protein
LAALTIAIKAIINFEISIYITYSSLLSIIDFKSKFHGLEVSLINSDETDLISVYIEDIDLINDLEENCEIESNLSPNLVEFIGKDASKLKVLPVGWEAPKVIHSYQIFIIIIIILSSIRI